MVVYLVLQLNTLPNVGTTSELHIAGAIALYIVCAVTELNMASTLTVL